MSYKILSIGNFGTGWDGSICDEGHIAGALEELGHEVLRVQREEASVGVLHDYVHDKKYDFTLIAQWDGYPERLFEQLTSECPNPIVYWAFDYQADGQEWHEKLVKEADLYLSKRIADSKYPNWQWLSQDFAPSFLKDVPKQVMIDTSGTVDIKDVHKDIDVLFTGSYLPWATERNETLKAIGEKFNLVIHSINEWPQGNEGPVMDEALPELYARAKINISIDHTLEAGYWSDRNAQIMACGGYILCRYVPLMEVRFGRNEEYLQYFYSIEDCLEKIQHRLGSGSETILQTGVRHWYGIDAQKYAQTNLMVTDRVKDLLTIVEGIL